MSIESRQISREDAYILLTDEQKTVLNEYVKRGKKTEWLNAWARKKGSVLTEEELEDPEKSMEKLLDWVLLDYEDSLTVNPKTKCECGRSLRYRYTVLHKETQRIYRLGIVHFEQHTGLSPEMVRLITKGFEHIDLERDEILKKVVEGWKIPFDIPEDMEIPKDMAEQIRVGLPLLERQVGRVSRLIIQHSNEKRKQSYNSKISTTHSDGQYQQIGFIRKGTAYTQSSTTDCELKPAAESSDNNMLSPMYTPNISPGQLYNKLKSITISPQEAREFYLYLKSDASSLDKLGVTLEQVKKDTIKALGRIDNREIRRWLVEIEYLRH